ncbi:MAG TPA: glycoside hydrolase family 3 N-terminal domain-containing protein [Thermoleophilaceae bacterium]|nr:glycoside hydrolase family 3 N-terminal domain-containing protein [Thermoleophilaceae bacterium]
MPAESARRRLALAVLAALALAAAVAGVVVGAGHGDGGEDASGVPSAGRDAPKEHISFLAKIVPPPAERQRGGGSPVPKSVADLARRLPLDRKVAQLFVVGFNGTDTTADIFGRLGRLELGGVVLASANYVDTTQLATLANEMAAVARERRHVPPWVFASQEGGELNSFPDLPPSAAPADLSSASEAEAQARDSAKNLRALGINAVLGPVVDVGSSETGSALGSRVYSDAPEEVATYADRVVRAYRDEHVFSTASHFPGLGATDQSTQDGPATVGLGLDELRQRDLIPFKAAIDAGVPGVIVSSALYPFSDFTVPASLSRAVDSTLLRREMRFKGVAMTDDLADPGITTFHTVPDAAVMALRAGADAIYISGSPGDQQAAYVAVLRAVQRGRIPRRRLDEAVGRILLAKQDYGLIR